MQFGCFGFVVFVHLWLLRFFFLNLLNNCSNRRYSIVVLGLNPSLRCCERPSATATTFICNSLPTVESSWHFSKIQFFSNPNQRSAFLFVKIYCLILFIFFSDGQSIAKAKKRNKWIPMDHGREFYAVCNRHDHSPTELTYFLEFCSNFNTRRRIGNFYVAETAKQVSLTDVIPEFAQGCSVPILCLSLSFSLSRLGLRASLGCFFFRHRNFWQKYSVHCTPLPWPLHCLNFRVKGTFYLSSEGNVWIYFFFYIFLKASKNHFNTIKLEWLAQYAMFLQHSDAYTGALVLRLMSWCADVLLMCWRADELRAVCWYVSRCCVTLFLWHYPEV